MEPKIVNCIKCFSDENPPKRLQWRTWLSQLHFSAAAVLTVQSLKQLKVVLTGYSLKTELKLKTDCM